MLIAKKRKKEERKIDRNSIKGSLNALWMICASWNFAYDWFAYEMPQLR